MVNTCLATSGSNLPVVVAARVTEGWSTDRAMDLQQSGVHDDILSILSHYCLQPSICSCLRTVSVALQIHDVKIISHDFTMVDCSIVVPPGFAPNEFMGFSLNPCTCDEARIKHVRVKFTAVQWDACVQHHDQVLVICGDFSQGLLTTDAQECGVIPVNEQPRNHGDENTVFMAEVFAGGFGGWSHAVNALNQIGGSIRRLWAIDRDPECAFRFAKSHDVTHVCDGPRQCWQQCNEMNHDKSTSFFLISNLKFLWWTPLMRVQGLDIWATSPPCPAWSLANSPPGFARADGLILVNLIGLVAACRPKVLLVENVSGMKAHKHFPLILALLRWAGYAVKHSGCSDVGQVMPQHRDRLTIIAIKIGNIDMFAHIPKAWPVDTKPSLGSHHVIVFGPHPWDAEVTLSANELKVYMNPNHLPKHVFTNGHSKRTTRDLMKYRVRTLNDQASCFSTSYGLPEDLDPSLLRDGGVFGSLFLCGTTLRKFAPVEIALMHAIMTATWIPRDWKAAMVTLGNAITVPHAVLAIINGVMFVCPDMFMYGVAETFSRVMKYRLQAEEVVFEADEHGIVIKRREIALTLAISPTQPFRCIARLTIASPTDQFVVWCEEGLDIHEVLSVLTGPSMPACIDICPNHVEEFRIPVAGDFRMLKHDTTLHAAVPSAMILQEKMFATKLCDRSIACFLTEFGVVAVRAHGEILVDDIEMVIDHLGWYQHEHVACTSLVDRPLQSQDVCPLLTIVMPEVHLDNMDEVEIVQVSHQFLAVPQGFVMKGSEQAMNRALNFLRQAKLITFVKCFGWHFSVDIPRTPQPEVLELHLTRMPGVLAVLQSAMRQLIESRVFAFLLDLRVLPLGVDVFVRIKLWDTWIWHGEMSSDTKGEVVTKAWLDASGLFGNQAEMRLIICGSRANPDFPISVYAKPTESGLRADIHLVLQLHGGGPHQSVSSGSEEDGNAVTGSEVQVGNHQNSSSIDYVHQAVSNLLSRQIHDRQFFVECIHDCKLVQADGFAYVQDEVSNLISLMQFLRHSGIEDVLNAEGWHCLLQFCRFEEPVVTRMVIVPIPQIEPIPLPSIVSVLVSCLFVLSFPPPMIQRQGSVKVEVKLDRHWIDLGWIDGSQVCETLINDWYEITTFAGSPSNMRMICRGKRVNIDRSISDYASLDSDGVLKARFFFVLELRGGGKAPKPEVQVKVKNAIASCLLSHGADLTPVSKFVDKLIHSAGFQTVQVIANMTNPVAKLDAIQKLGHTLNIETPPTNKAAASRQQSQPKRPSAGKQDFPATCFQIQEGFFRNANGSACKQVDDIQTGSHGIVLLSPKDATLWLQSHKSVSTDELGVLVLGSCPIQGSCHCNPVNTPAIGPHGAPVILSTCLHNLGDSKISWQTSAKADIQVTSTVVVAVTCFQDEVSQQTWSKVKQSPVKACLEILTGSGVNVNVVCPPWGRSWREDQSGHDSLQFHCRIDTASLHTLLKVSGQQGVYVSAKTESQTIDTQYAIIWLDQPPQELRVTLATCTGHLGLIRIDKARGKKTNRGIRCLVADHDRLFKLLKPDSTPAPHVACKVFAKLAPTPTGATQNQVTEWLEQVGWTAKAIRPLGSNAWLLGAPEKIDATFASWNQQSLLLNWLPSKETVDRKVVLAGPKPKQEVIHKNDGATQQDPWATYLANKQQTKPLNTVDAQQPATAASRAVSGPIDERFKQQEEVINQLRGTVAQISEKIDTQGLDHEKLKESVAKEFHDIREEIKTSCDNMNESFANSLTLALQKQDQRLHQNFSELKAMLQDRALPSKKAKVTKPGTAMEEDQE